MLDPPHPSHVSSVYTNLDGSDAENIILVITTATQFQDVKSLGPRDEAMLDSAKRLGP